VIQLNFPDGARLEVAADELWRLTDQLVSADAHIPHAVATAADLRLAIKGTDEVGEVDLTQQHADALSSLHNVRPLRIDSGA